MDQRGRLVLPVSFREALGDKYIVTRGLDKCVWLFAPDEYTQLEDRITQLPEISNREIYRFIIGSRVECASDPQDRLVIPLELREHAELERDLVIVGQARKVEIWSRRVWKEHCAKVEEKVAEMMEGLDL